MPKQYLSFGIFVFSSICILSSQNHQGVTLIHFSNHFIKGLSVSTVRVPPLFHSPPGTSCHEALKPLPFMELSVLNRIASAFPVLETCMGFADDLWEHNWVNLGE